MLSLETGTEFDSNIHRFENQGDVNRPIDRDVALRAAARMRITTAGASGGSAGLNAVLANKTFVSSAGQSENLLNASLDGQFGLPLPNTSARAGARLLVYNTGHYRLSSAAPGSMDIDVPTFTTLGTDGWLEVAGPGDHRVRLSLGPRRFLYDIDPNQSFWAGDSNLVYRNRILIGDPDVDLDAKSLDVSAYYRGQHRNFDRNAVENRCREPGDATCLFVGATGRVDANHLVGAEMVFTTRQIWSLRYEFELNRSNSFGYSFLRHRAEAKFASEIGRSGLFVVATGTLLFHRFADPFLVARNIVQQNFVSVEDENRNGLALSLIKDIGQRLSIESRYAFYTNEIASDSPRFRRHTVYAGIIWRWDSE
jgi:hypothetical protein